MLDKQIIDFLINWFPMLLLIAVWVFFLQRMRSGKGYFSKYQKDCMELTRRQVEALERIANILEKKAS